MLDADASFRPDPELPAPHRLDAMTAHLTPDPGPIAADPLPTESLPDTAIAPTSDNPAPADIAATDTAVADIAVADTTDLPPDARPVTPRRLLRFSAARGIEDTRVQALPVLNLFDGVFESEDDLTDPRLLRSRARARRLLAAHEAGLSEAERNLWHDDPQPEPAPAPALAPTEPQGRRIRHLTAADIAPHAPAPIVDPLRDHLQAVRAALYAPDPDAPPPVERAGLGERLMAPLIATLLFLLSRPLGMAKSASTLLRAPDLRGAARAAILLCALGTLLPVVSLLQP